MLHGPRGDGEPGKVLYLADNAAFGFALARLYEATHDAGVPRRRDSASPRVVTGDRSRTPQGGGFYSSTPDPDAVGVFAARRKPFEDDVMAAPLPRAAARASRPATYLRRRSRKALPRRREPQARSRTAAGWSATCSSRSTRRATPVALERSQARALVPAALAFAARFAYSASMSGP